MSKQGSTSMWPSQQPPLQRQPFRKLVAVPSRRDKPCSSSDLGIFRYMITTMESCLHLTSQLHSNSMLLGTRLGCVFTLWRDSLAFWVAGGWAMVSDCLIYWWFRQWRRADILGWCDTEWILGNRKTESHGVDDGWDMLYSSSARQSVFLYVNLVSKREYDGFIYEIDTEVWVGSSVWIQPCEEHQRNTSCEMMYFDETGQDEAVMSQMVASSRRLSAPWIGIEAGSDSRLKDCGIWSYSGR